MSARIIGLRNVLSGSRSPRQFIDIAERDAETEVELAVTEVKCFKQVGTPCLWRNTQYEGCRLSCPRANLVRFG